MSTCAAQFRCLLDNSERTYERGKEGENPWLYDPIYGRAFGIRASISGEFETDEK